MLGNRFVPGHLRIVSILILKVNPLTCEEALHACEVRKLQLAQTSLFYASCTKDKIMNLSLHTRSITDALLDQGSEWVWEIVIVIVHTRDHMPGNCRKSKNKNKLCLMLTYRNRNSDIRRTIHIVPTRMQPNTDLHTHPI